MNFRKITSNYFSIILIISCLIGINVPSLGKITGYVILLLLFSIIFASYFQMQLKNNTVVETVKRCYVFLFLRYILVPIILFFAILPFSSFYAFALFFLALLPAGVSSPAYARLFNASINLSLIILICSSFIVVVTIPILTPLFAKESINISFNRLVYTLSITIILSFILHLPLRRNKKIKHWMNDNLSVVTVVCLSFLFIIATAHNKAALLNSYNLLPEFILIGSIFITFCYIIGWFLMGNNQTIQERFSYSVGSGMNNIGLGISLATLYFEPNACVFFIICQFMWVVILLPLRFILKKYSINTFKYN